VVTSATPAAPRQRRGSQATLFLMPITGSVYRPRATAIVAAQAAGLLRWEYLLLPVR
jgi:hypothetical protein